jgi:uncharacterized protein
MEHESQSNLHEEPASNAAISPSSDSEPVPAFESPFTRPPKPPERHFAEWVFLGSDGLRAGWSIALLLILFILIGGALGLLISLLHLSRGTGHMTVRTAFLGEFSALVALIGAASIVALIERRSLLDFNLNGPRRAAKFLSGAAAGFLALSVLVGALWAGGWLRFGSVALSGTDIAKYAALWGLTFLFVGLFEEGAFRCYLQFTLTRGINFWWALAIQALVCATLILRNKGTAAWGIYTILLLGLLPCLMLHVKRTAHSNFWQAAWVSSTLFGFIHVGNNGENWIGVFAAAVIGFVFCVSIRLTGSAWWAIGCHAGWDWAETYFYGTADSGMVAPGHYLSTSPFGNTFWSGGADGPEGSILVLAAILLLLIALLVIYRPRQKALPQLGSEQA